VTRHLTAVDNEGTTGDLEPLQIATSHQRRSEKRMSRLREPHLAGTERALGFIVD
jgi:hypothetical protein